MSQFDVMFLLGGERAFNCQGNPGGTLCGMTSAWYCGVYECSNDTNTNYLDGKNVVILMDKEQ